MPKNTEQVPPSNPMNQTFPEAGEQEDFSGVRGKLNLQVTRDDGSCRDCINGYFQISVADILAADRERSRANPASQNRPACLLCWRCRDL